MITLYFVVTFWIPIVHLVLQLWQNSMNMHTLKGFQLFSSGKTYILEYDSFFQHRHNRAAVKFRFVSVSALSTYAQFRERDTVLSFVEQLGEKLEVLCFMQLRFLLMQIALNG